MRSSSRAFSLVELLVVVAIMAVLISFAVPRFLGARRSANETSAIATMRAIVAAEMALQAASSIDTDSDGQSEYGYFGEMGGTIPARIAVGGAPAAGVVGVDELDPSPLIQSLGSVSQSVVTHSGYVFQLWLPGTNTSPIAGLAEDVGGGKTSAPFPDPDATETRFCAYGWPVRAGFTGTRCFFVNQEGVILEMKNRGASPYSGVGGGPAFDAAFTLVGDMGAGFARGGPAVDGNTWVAVQ